LDCLILSMRDGMRSGDNIFDQMEAIHIAKVLEELALRFGFPEKKWKTEWKAHLSKQPGNQNEVSVFLRFGHERIEPVLNGLLLRRSSHPTFSKLCEYIIKREPRNVKRPPARPYH